METKKGQSGFDFAYVFADIRLLVDRDEITTVVKPLTGNMVRPTTRTWYGKKRYLSAIVNSKESGPIKPKENHPQKSSKGDVVKFETASILDKSPESYEKNGFTIECELINHHPGWVNQARIYGFRTNWEKKDKGSNYDEDFNRERWATMKERLFFVPLSKFDKNSLNTQTLTADNGNQGTIAISYEVQVLE